MKPSIFFVSILLCYAQLQAQRSELGSLTAKDTAILKQIERTKDPAVFHKLAVELIMLSDDKSAIPLFDLAKYVYDLSKRRKSVFLETISLSMYGQGYRITGNFTKALQYHLKAIELSKKTPDVSLTGFVLNQSAHMYKDREENRKAISIYKEAISYAEKGSDSLFLFYPNMNLGFVYLNENKTDSALFFSSNALRMLRGLMSNLEADTKEIIERSVELYCISNLAGAYSKLGNKPKADEYYKEAIQIINHYPHAQSRYFQFFYFNQAKHFQRFGIIDSSLIAARFAVESVIGTPFAYLSAGPAKLLSDYYETHNADSAVKFLKIYLRGNEIMNSTRVTQQLQALSFEEEQRKLELERTEKTYKSRVIQYVLGIGFVSVLIIAIFINRSSQQRKRVNQELEIQKQKLETTLTELKSTQTQLIQSEKMASLGELTAGIAHEIQNPLNFVNNFSELNNELLQELGPLDKLGVTADQQDILKDLQSNSEKINHHGQRAAAIVKGMLQHSRTSSGQKEPTDINALCDEYLRLAYHGLRAKDKNFNAEFRTDFDETLP
ncbi:MAG: tetratricopeptide repeat protein, partial [Thermosphaera sp.]